MILSGIAVYVFFTAFAVHILMLVLLPFLRRRLLDHPNFRSSHTRPTPRGGGLVFVLVASVVSFLSISSPLFSSTAPLPVLAAPLLALPLSIVGFFDDLYTLPAFLRYIIQLSTALWVTFLSPLHFYSFSFLLFPVLIIAVTATINFINFMDGLDGLVAGCMSVVFIAAGFYLSAPGTVWGLVGALFGFLFWNWSPAKVFMGDVGSTFLGVVFVVFTLQLPSWLDAFSLFLVATPLLGDACLCVLRRLMAGQRVFQAHRLHLFQRLHQAGWSHARVSSLYIAATAVLALALFWGGLPWVITLAALELFLGIWLDQQVAVSFVVASRS